MTQKRKTREEWLNDKVKFWVLMGGVIFSIFSGVGGRDTQIALLDQKLEIFETNHLSHVEKDIDEMRKEVGVIVTDIKNVEIALAKLEQTIINSLNN